MRIKDYIKRLFEINNKKLLENKYNYSLEEQVVGTWIDGKPVYQKTFSTITPSVKDTNLDIIDLSELNIDKSLNIDGIVINSSGYKYPINIHIHDADYLSCWFRPTSIAMRVSEFNVNIPFNLTIQYTKTTD